MRRVCFIGNSHVGAIKKALEDTGTVETQTKSEVVIFGSHRNTMNSAYVKDGVIQSDDDEVKERFRWTSGYASEVEISTFDEIVFVVGKSHFSILPFTAKGIVPDISEGVIEAVWKSAEEDWPYKLAKAAALECEKTMITFLGVPFKSSESPEAKLVLENVCAHSEKRIRKIQRSMVKSASDRATGNFRLKRPPKTALDDLGLFTRHEYCKGSVRLSEGLNNLHSKDDYNHMNADYGKLLLEEYSN